MNNKKSFIQTLLLILGVIILAVNVIVGGIFLIAKIFHFDIGFSIFIYFAFHGLLTYIILFLD